MWRGPVGDGAKRTLTFLSILLTVNKYNAKLAIFFQPLPIMHSKRPYGFRFHDFFLPLPHENFHYISTGNSHRSNGSRMAFLNA
jgi:hypothetical protein